MFDRELVREVIVQILTAIARIERRAARISEASDFVSSDAGPGFMTKSVEEIHARSTT